MQSLKHKATHRTKFRTVVTLKEGKKKKRNTRFFPGDKKIFSYPEPSRGPVSCYLSPVPK